MFEQHKLLFSFHMCVKILDAQGKIIPGEYAFLLHGGIVLDRENQPDKPVPWLPDETWDNVTELDKLPGFHGVVSSLEQFPRDWHNWYVLCHVVISTLRPLSTYFPRDTRTSSTPCLIELACSVLPQ